MTLQMENIFDNNSLPLCKKSFLSQNSTARDYDKLSLAITIRSFYICIFSLQAHTFPLNLSWLRPGILRMKKAIWMVELNDWRTSSEAINFKSVFVLFKQFHCKHESISISEINLLYIDSKIRLWPGSLVLQSSSTRVIIASIWIESMHSARNTVILCGMCQHWDSDSWFRGSVQMDIKALPVQRICFRKQALHS